MYQAVLEEIKEEVLKAGDSALDEILKELEEKINKEHSPKILFVSNLFGKDAVDTLAKKIYDDVVIGNDSCMQKNAPFEVDIRCGEDFRTLDGRLVTDYDLIILFTDAVMALPQKEKEWLRNTVEIFSGGERIIVTLYRKEAVNTEEDLSELCGFIKETTAAIDEKIRFYADDMELLPRIREVGEYTWEKRQKRQNAIFKYYVSVLAEEIRMRLKFANVDREKLEQNVKRMEQEQKSTELAGKIAVENTVESFYVDLKNQIFDAAEQYNEDAYDNIRNRISTSKNIKRDAENIPAYLDMVWKNFDDKIREEIARKQSEAARRLQKQIEEDCNNLAGYLELPEDFREFSEKSRMIYEQMFPADVDGGKRRDKLVFRGMMLASVTLAFINPVWGLSALAGSGLYWQYKAKGEEELRAEVLNGIYSKCNEIKKGVVEEIYAAIDKVKEESKRNVSDIYSEMIESFVDSIREMVEKQENLKKHCGILEDILMNKLPGIESRL